MEVSSTCSLPVTSLVWRRTPKMWVQTIVCKATFDLVPGVARLSDRQEPLHDEDQHRGGDPARSLHVPGDRVPVKARADVLLVGSAFAPDGLPVRSLVARLGVGDVVKAVEVFGARRWGADGALHERAPFSSMSLAYERAAGGPDTWNPVGITLGAGAGDAAALPNLQPLDQAFARRGDFIAPIGFGPLAATWPLRAHLLGRHAAFTLAHLRDHPMPEGLDPGYFNAAPPDQQVEELRGDEQLLLENLHRDHPRLSTRLPGLVPDVRLELHGVPPQKLRMRGDTLWIDTDRALCTVTWRGQVPLQRRDEAGRVVVALATLEEPGGERPTEPRALPSASTVTTQTLVETPLSPEDAVRTQPLALTRMASALPFVRPMRTRKESARPREALAPPPPPVTPALAPVAHEVPRPPLVVPVAVEKETAMGGVLGASNAAAGALPKVEKPAAEAAPRAAPKPVREAPREMLELLWFDPAALPRIRRNLAWKKIIADLKPRPSDDDFDGGLPPDAMKAAKDRRDVFGVLARGEAMDMEGIRRAMEMAVLDDGSFVPPFVLAAGVVEMAFDEHETLAATLVAVAPFVPLDKKLKEVVDHVNEVMRTPGLARARGVSAGLCEKVRAAFGQQGRGVPAGWVEEQVEAMLLEGRCFQKRTVTGAPHVKATFRTAREAEAVPAYLAEEGEKGLPAVRWFEARVLAEARPRRDACEAASVELRVVAVARRMGGARV